MVCTGDPDPTFTETNIPWVVRVILMTGKAVILGYNIHKRGAPE